MWRIGGRRSMTERYWKYIWEGPISPVVKYGRAKIGHLCFELLCPVGTIDNATTQYQVLSQLFHLMNLLAQLLDKHACGRCAHLGLHLSHATPFFWGMESFQHARDAHSESSCYWGPMPNMLCTTNRLPHYHSSAFGQELQSVGFWW